MTIEVSLLIGGVSVAFAIFMGITGNRRNQKIDTRQDATEMTTVIVKLENIGMGVNEIKQELASVKKETRDLSERVVVLEFLTKETCRRTDNIENRRSGE